MFSAIRLPKCEGWYLLDLNNSAVDVEESPTAYQV